MTRFYPLYARRSDGKTEITTKGKRKESNQPTEDQLDQKPDRDGVSDFYREVGMDEVKHLDWRRKLGGMLARELDLGDKTGSASDTGHIFVTFPLGYRLYEHVKRTEKDGKLEVKSKTHAAGGNDRQDAYLYGHPAGRKKRFRSPADFFPHLLWLCTDERGDPDNCSCKLCCPEELDSVLPANKTVDEKPAKQISDARPASDAKPAPDVPVIPPARTAALQPSARPSSNTPVQTSIVTPKSATLPPESMGPCALAPCKTHDQYFDRLYNGFMFRPGELVWFQRGTRWGLGIITRRWASNTAHQYRVQPLSHPFKHSPAVFKDSKGDVRPWLAWSVPKFTSEGLNALVDPPRYETMDWQALMNKHFGDGDIEVDGSILAAKAISASFTLTKQIGTREPEPGVIETMYDAIFLGAEKIWTGEPVRLRIGSGTDIMVVHLIVDRKRVSAMQQQPSTTQQSSVYFIGDVYTLATVMHNNPNLPTLASPSNNPHLPPRLTEDLAFRNARSIQARHEASYWRLARAQARVEINDVKGRWYEASKLMPMLYPDVFEDAARRGEIQESSLWMNSRGDCINANRDKSLPSLPRENVRKASRLEALGGAVPRDMEIYDGLDPPNVDPALDAATMQQQQQQQQQQQHQQQDRNSGGGSGGGGAGAGAGGANRAKIDPRFDTGDGGNDLKPQQQDSSGLQIDGGGREGIDEFMNLDSMDDSGHMSGYTGHGEYY